MKKRITRTVRLWLALLLIFGQVMTVSAAAPKLNASVTKKNVLALANACDKDAACILQNSVKKKRNILEWWNAGDSLWSGMDTAVHEECHAYSFLNASYNSIVIYLGNKKSIKVPYTSVYPSKKMASDIPKKLRTFRWETYVGKPIANLSSNVQGVYGLLNEFTAYCWGMHMTLSLYDYLKKNKATSWQWMTYINGCANGRLAYAEFKYYILHYLYYAKRHYSSIYKKIKNNKNFVKAYKSIEKKFAAQNKEFTKNLKKLGWTISDDGWCVNSKLGYRMDIYQKDYDNLTKEMKKKKYKNLL